MTTPTVRICRCGCGKALPAGSHGNARNHPDCLAEVRKKQNREAAKKARAAASRGFTGSVATWPRVHLPAVYALEITALAARLAQEADQIAYETNPEICEPEFLATPEEITNNTRMVANMARELFTALATRLPAPDVWVPGV